MPVRTTNAKAEAKYNVTTEFPSFGLHAAAATGNMGLVEYALARGQPVNSVLDGVLPLHAACAGGSEPVVKLLIDHGADVNGPRLPRRYSNEKNTVIIGTSGSTPLHFAAANGNMNIVKLLLRRGAIADRPDKHGITPEMVARQNGFVECADFLHSWICNKDKDLRERDFRTGRDTQSPERADTPDPYGDAASGSRRLKVKRSIDTALSMLKASSSGLSEQYQKAANSSGHSIAERRADTMPRKLSDAGPQSPILENGPPPGFDPNYRRPSLPQLEHPRLASPARFSHRTSHYSSRRPRSAGTDAEQEAEQAVYIPYGRGGAGRKLGNKYSIRNFLNKRRDGSVTPSFADPFSSQQAAASSGASSSILDSNSHTPISSSPPHHVHSASDTLALPASYASTLTAMDSQSSQLSNNTPSAVDLHNALAQQQRNRDRSASGGSRTRFELPAQDDTERQPSGGASRSPLKPDSNTAQARARSPSGASSTPNRSGAVFDDDVVIPRETPVKRPGILRPHNRTSSGGQSGSSIRALRFDSSSSISERTSSYNSNNSSTSRFGLRGCNSAGSLKHGSKAQAGKRPGSAGNPISRISSEASADVSSAVEDEEDDSYGEIIHKQPSFEKEEVEDPRRARGFSVNSTDSQISPGVLLSGPEHAETTAEFPFSISRPPPVSAGSDSATSSPNLLRVPLPASNGARGRGDSLSSVSSAGCQEPSLIMSTTSHSDGSATTPTMDVFTSHSSDTSLAHNIANLNERRSHTPLGIDLSAISSHAQAEALVQKAQQDILAADTDIPLSARLAAYGESLALERRLREEKEKKKEGRGSVLIAHGPMSGTSSPSLTPSMLPSTPMPNSARSWIEEADKHTSPTLTRQSSTGKAERRRHRKNMVKVPRRPHTSTGATGHSIMPDIAVNGRRLRTVSDDPRLHHTCHSTSSLEGLEAPTSPVQEEDAPASPAAGVPQTPVTPVATQLSRVSSLDANNTDTDGELGESRLYRVSTAPHASPGGGRSAKGVDNEARKASAQKLARMGFAPHDRTPQNTKRFGGLKSWVQSFKGKPV